MKPATRKALKRFGQLILFVGVAALLGAMFLAAFTNVSFPVGMVILGMLLPPIVIAALLFMDMNNSSSEDLMNQLYGPGSRIGGLDRHRTERRGKIRHYNETFVTKDDRERP